MIVDVPVSEPDDVPLAVGDAVTVTVGVNVTDAVADPVPVKDSDADMVTVADAEDDNVALVVPVLVVVAEAAIEGDIEWLEAGVKDEVTDDVAVTDGVVDIEPENDEDADDVPVREAVGVNDAVLVSVGVIVADAVTDKLNEDVTDEVLLLVPVNVVLTEKLGLPVPEGEYVVEAVRVGVTVSVAEVEGEELPVTVTEHDGLTETVGVAEGVALRLAGASNSTVSPVPSCP